MKGEPIKLESSSAFVTVRPDVGAEVVEFVDRRTGTNLLWRSPAGQIGAGDPAWDESSRDYWIRRTGGGWNLLLPHAGTERMHQGVTLPFHGEAGTARWAVDSRTEVSATLSTRLTTSPLLVERVVRLDQGKLTISDRVTNDSPVETVVSWGHHPTFGAPFIEPGVRIELSATQVRTDPLRPGGAWPMLEGIDLSIVPAHADRRALLAYISGVNGGSYRILNDRLAIGVEMTWPTELFSHLWLWQEFNATDEFPWFGRAYAMAIEPQSTIPEGGEPVIRISAGETRSAEVSLQLLQL